jgi:hypothetical protein
MQLHGNRIVAAAIVIALAGCSSDANTPLATGILAKIASVQTTTGVLATIKQGTVPAAQGGPSVNLPSALSLVNGGTGAMNVTSAASLFKVAIGIDGVSGYYEVDLPAGTTSASITSVTLLITLAQNLSDTSLPLVIAAADGNSNFGASQHLTATVTRVGSGDVQVSLSWDGPSDLDLHVVGPDSSEVYYSNRTSASGGTLDLDSNAACTIDNIDNENVTWPSGKAPSGTYTVRADYWSNCGRDISNYVVTVTIAGGTPQIFQGSFTGTGDRGGAGSGRLITTFVK